MPRAVALSSAVLLAAGVVALTGAPASAASTDVAISQVYGGGGNAGATLTNDFIELRNTSAAAVDVTGWSVQYGAATGTSFQVTQLTGSIPAGGHFLVQEAAGAGGTQPLPTPDATGGINMSGTAGKVALVTNVTALTCGSACSTAAGVKDFVGFGPTANDSETAPTAVLSNTTAALRNDGPDTDNNSADFTVGTPNPRSTGGGTTPPPPPPGESGLRIHDIQGAAQVSPKVGVRVLDVPGVVTTLSFNGFWFQDPTPDANPATSEGLFVFTNSRPTVAVGDSVTVTGTVAEFRPGGAATNLSTTEITGPTVTTVGTGATVPAPVVVGPGGLTPPSTVIENDANGDVEKTETAFDPANDGLDFWESLEGERISITDAQVVGPTNQFDETSIVPPGSTVRTTRGGIVMRSNDPNPERIVVADTLVAANGIPKANVGDSYAGATVGVVDYNFGNFELLPSVPPTVVSGGLQRETTKKPNLLQLSVATFNVENLAPTDPQTKFDTLAQFAVHNLQAPDVLALEEIQDNSGATDDGVVAADQTIAKLTTAIRAAGGPAYQNRSIDPVNDQDGGQPGGNIRVVFLYRTDRGLSFVDRPGGTSTVGTTVVRDAAGKPHLSFSPGRIDPTNVAWTDSRKPLAGEFRWRGQTVFVIANHFVSKGGDDPLFGRFQPISQPSQVQRNQQATEVRDFVDQIEAADSRAKVVVVGDLNDFDFSTPVNTLTSTGSLIDLPRTLPIQERYTYVFEGNSEVLDHILLSPTLAYAIPSRSLLPLFEYDPVHVNSEFDDQVSDHDPQVVRLLVTP